MCLGKRKELVEGEGGCRSQNWNLSKERDAPNPQLLPDCENSLAGCDPAAAGGWVSRVVR